MTHNLEVPQGAVEIFVLYIVCDEFSIGVAPSVDLEKIINRHKIYYCFTVKICDVEEGTLVR